MPRISAEDRSAAYYRAGKKPPSPPRGMTPAARSIWREIVNSKPVDWFDAGSLRTLRIHCENTAAADRVARRQAEVDPGSIEFRHLSSAMKSLTIILASSSRQLRLTVQQQVDTRSAKAGEPGVLDHPLLGGNAVSERPN